MSREKLAEVAARLGRADLAALATSDVLWDEVESLEPDGEEEVFDVSVPGMHNFVANGLFVHNSGAIEQDADTIIFIYRDDYYNPETSDLKGIAELIIAKQRNGPTGKVKVRFSASYTRFDNLEPGDYPETNDE
jgi:replicative DNA helicase